MSASAPSLTPNHDVELQVYFYGTQNHLAPVITEPAAIISRANTALEPGGIYTRAWRSAGAASRRRLANIYREGELPEFDAGFDCTGGSARADGRDSYADSYRSDYYFDAHYDRMQPTSADHADDHRDANRHPDLRPQFRPRSRCWGLWLPGPLTDSAQPLTNVNVGVPLGTQPGDVLLAEIAIYDTGSNVPFAPAGWTLIRSDSVSNANKLTAWLYYKVAAGNEPAS